MSREELLNLIFKLADERGEFRQILLESISIAPHILNRQPKNPTHVKRLKSQITKAIKESGCYQYDNYSDDLVDISGLDSVFTEGQALNPADQIEVYWHLVKSASGVVEEYGLSTTQIEEAIGLYSGAVKSLGLSQGDKRTYFDILCDAFSWDMCGYGDVTEAIKKALDTICTEPDDYRYLIKKLNKMEDHPETGDWIAGYYLQLGDEKNYLKIRLENLFTESQYLDLALFWKNKGEAAKYLSTLEDWVKTLPELQRQSGYPLGGRSLSDGIFKRLAEHYDHHRDSRNLCRVLMAAAEYDQLTVELYQRIQGIAQAIGTWAQDQPALMAIARKNSTTLAKIYLYEKQWEDAVRLAEQTEHYDSVKVLVAEGIKQVKPLAAIGIYQRLLEWHINRRSRKHYSQAARYAGAIKDIHLTVTKDKNAWQALIDGIRKQYPRLPALQDEFRNL